MHVCLGREYVLMHSCPSVPIYTFEYSLCVKPITSICASWAPGTWGRWWESWGSWSRPGCRRSHRCLSEDWARESSFSEQCRWTLRSSHIELGGRERRMRMEITLDRSEIAFVFNLRNLWTYILPCLGHCTGLSFIYTDPVWCAHTGEKQVAYGC